MKKQKDGSWTCSPNDQTALEFLNKNFGIKVADKERIGGAFYAGDKHTAQEFADMVHGNCKWNVFGQEVQDKIDRYLKDNDIKHFTVSMVKR